MTGKYVYFATDTYPFFPRCAYGDISSDFAGPQGNNQQNAKRQGDNTTSGQQTGKQASLVGRAKKATKAGKTTNRQKPAEAIASKAIDADRQPLHWPHVRRNLSAIAVQ
jgi:hypothetical protein